LHPSQQPAERQPGLAGDYEQVSPEGISTVSFLSGIEQDIAPNSTRSQERVVHGCFTHIPKQKNNHNWKHPIAGMNDDASSDLVNRRKLFHKLRLVYRRFTRDFAGLHSFV
jgi:hypothetical protein